MEKGEGDLRSRSNRLMFALEYRDACLGGMISVFLNDFIHR